MSAWHGFLIDGLRDARSEYRRLRRKYSRVPLDIRHRWRRLPSPLGQRRVCVLACYSVDGRLSPHTLFLGQAWRDQGFSVLLVVATARPEELVLDESGCAGFEGILIRSNSGYDFGSWATALRLRPDLYEARLLALANDSVYGPLNGFAPLIERAEAAPEDIVGITESLEVQRHLQSYLVFYKPRALTSEVFRKFWSRVGGDGRDGVIEKSEIPQRSKMVKGGLSVSALFPAAAPTRGKPGNPTLDQWRGLLDQGFPFVKVQLLKSSSHWPDMQGWDRIMSSKGYDPALVVEHLAAHSVRPPRTP